MDLVGWRRTNLHEMRKKRASDIMIKVNKIKCLKCGDIIESKHRHDFKFCSCGAVAIDGGKDYLKRLGNREDYEELSE